MYLEVHVYYPASVDQVVWFYKITFTRKVKSRESMYTKWATYQYLTQNYPP